jgi:hemolysin III
VTTVAPPAPTPPLLRGWLHVAGAVALVGCSPILLVRSHTWSQVGWVVCYLVGVEVMLITSALYHRGHWSPSQRRAFRRADYSAIYLAITGSYLAIAGLTMHGTIRLVLLLIECVGAAIGIVGRQLKLDTKKWVSTVPFLLVAWAAVAVMPQIYRGGGPLCFSFIVAGGLAYTAGAIAFAFKRPRLSPRVFGFHELFHASTLLGVGFTFCAIYVALR